MILNKKHDEWFFNNEFLISNTQKPIFQGVKMKIDDVGNVWLKCTEGSIFVTGILGEITVKNDPIKVRGEFSHKIIKIY